MPLKVVVAIPCYNEEATIAKVIGDFRSNLPQAEIYVFDNKSMDKSVELARQAGANIVHVPRQGKGNVLRSIFDHIKADAIVLVDGDDTYFAEEVHILLEPVLRGEADMTVGDRLLKADHSALRSLNRLGNGLILKTINIFFGTAFHDVLSGYRVFNRRFVESIPLLTPGFETETELTLQALEEGMTVLEMPISYRRRPVNSSSKLRPFFDGWRIMVTIAMILRDHQPLRLYGFLSAVSFLIVALAGILRLLSYQGIMTLSDSFLAGIILLFLPVSLIFLGIGLMLSAINTRLREIKQIMMRNRKI